MSVFSASLLTLAVLDLFLLRRLVTIFNVRAFLIIKSCIVFNCRFEFPLGTVFCSVKLFSL